MTAFSVDLDTLTSVIHDLAAFEKTLADKLTQLDQAVDQLHLTWSGDAAAGHRDAHTRWRAGATEMHQAGVRMRLGAERAHANYIAASDTNAQMWKQAR